MIWTIDQIVRSLILHGLFGSLWVLAFWLLLSLTLTIPYMFWDSGKLEDSSTRRSLYWGVFFCSSGLGLLSHIFVDSLGLGF